MKTTKIVLAFCLALFFISKTEAQTKKIKRPKSRVGIRSVDNFVQESFDLYDKVYKYDGYAANKTPLNDDDIDVLEDALEEMTVLSESAPDILNDLEGVSLLKQGKATLQINKAKRALKYSIKTTKALLIGNRKEQQEKDTKTNKKKPSQPSKVSSSDKTQDLSQKETKNISDHLEINSKFDFVPGDKLIYFDDFSQDFIGDFPSKWNTNGTGEVVTFNGAEGKWFELKDGYGIKYIPLLEQALPEEYTIEFDLLAIVDKKTSPTARINITLDDTNEFKTPRNRATVEIPLGIYGAFNIKISNKINNEIKINSSLNSDLRKIILNQPHISIAVNKRRFRLWINQKKYIDIPQLIAPNNTLSHIKFSLAGMRDGEDHLFVSNLKVAEGGVDLRRKLMSEGKISTNGILFKSGSDKIQPQSYGIIRQISQVLMQDSSMRLKIIGHTDSDGPDNTNLELSKARANAVKEALISIYNIPKDRLETDGKGETQPIGDNNTLDGKALNRRVEFVKI